MNKQYLIKPISLLLIITLLLPSSSLLASNLNSQDAAKDYYYEGQAAAQRDYSGGGAMIGGLASGIILGLIGWGLGYLIVSNQNIEVPRRYTSDLETKERMEFEDGYKAAYKKARNSKYNMGGGIGTLVAVVIVSSASTE